MPENESFIAFEKEGGLFWRSQSGEPKQIGITMKVANQLKDALSETIEDRDSCRAECDSHLKKLIDVGLHVVPKTPEEVAAEALAATKATEANMVAMAHVLNEQGELLRQLLTERQERTLTQAQPDEQQEQSTPVHAKPERERGANKK